MADYKESTVTGTSWQRVYRVRIDNPTGETPSLTFYEERVTNIGGDKTIKEHVGTLSARFDPMDANHVDLYSKLNDLYVLMREARDVEVPPEEPLP